MRPSQFTLFLRLVLAGSVGTFLGVAVAGVVGVIVTDAAHRGTWLEALPVLAVLGAVLGAPVGRLTRHWLAPRYQHRRVAVSAVAGVILVPLAVAPTPPAVVLPLALAGFIATTTIWVRGRRHATSQRTTRHPHERPRAAAPTGRR